MTLVPEMFALLALGALGGFGLARIVFAERAPSQQADEAIADIDPERRADGRFERLIRNLPLAAMTFGRRGTIVSFNPTAAALFGLDPQRTIGKTLIEAIPSVELERQVNAALRGESSMRSIVISEIESERTFNIAAFPTDADGDVVLIASDQTQLVALEKVRHEFISNVSHELRTPLSSIKLMVETVLLSEGDTEAGAMFLPKVLREVDRMVQLVEDLLQVAHSESGRLALRREWFDLSAFASSNVNMFTQRAQALDIRLRIEAPAGLQVQGDRNRLTQVFVNLLDNALRHTPAGGSVTVTVERQDDEAVFSVHDTGIGIPYNDLPHIFERFYVVERSRAREISGTGLGLSIAKQLLEAHGGSISAESVLGSGATFTCRIPVGVPAVETKVS
ncbi:MAG TPA: ATP-binding protein [Candidatus Binatia bacterium]|nr:ATP-binding protein [Candidatus Binatia bacterium]